MLSKANIMKNLGKVRSEKIELYQSVKISDGAGGYKTTWVLQATVWSEFKKPNLSTEVINGAVASDVTRELGIRYRADIKKGWQVKYGAKTFNVIGTYDYSRETTILICREVVM